MAEIIGRIFEPADDGLNGCFVFGDVQAVVSFPRPINKQRFPDHRLARDEFILPKAAVKAVIAVIAHHEIHILRHGDRPEIVAAQIMRRAVGLLKLRVRLGLRLLVHVHDFIADFNRVAAECDNPLNEIPRRVIGIFEHDDLPALRVGKTINKLVD